MRSVCGQQAGSRELSIEVTIEIIPIYCDAASNNN